MISIAEFRKSEKPISLITCYDYTSACIISETNIDAVLVGDSTAMVMHGYETTVNANIDMMCFHVSAVRRGVNNKFLIADLPFLEHRKGLLRLMDSIDRLIKCGAQAVKIEGANGNIESISHIVKSGIPVMGHIGLTPQSIHKLGGYKVQGKNEKKAEELFEDAKTLESAGCFSIVLELIPSMLAKKITETLSVPTIGIGAGPFTSGQVLVLQDMLGMNKNFRPKFLKTFMNGFDQIKNAINQYDVEVKQNIFPGEKESF